MTVPAPPQSTKKVDAGRIPGSFTIGNCFEVRLIFGLANEKQATCRTFGGTGGTVTASVTLANALHTALSTAWSTRLSAFLNPLVTFDAVTVRDMTASTNPEFRSTNAAHPSGAPAGDALPQDVAAVLTAEGDDRGRGAKGRLYLPGWAEVANAGTGQMTGPCQTAITNFGLDLFNTLQGNGLTPAIGKPPRREYIGTTGALHPARGAVISIVSAYVCQNTEWDTQRRRGF